MQKHDSPDVNLKYFRNTIIPCSKSIDRSRPPAGFKRGRGLRFSFKNSLNGLMLDWFDNRLNWQWTGKQDRTIASESSIRLAVQGRHHTTSNLNSNSNNVWILPTSRTSEIHNSSKHVQLKLVRTRPCLNLFSREKRQRSIGSISWRIVTDLLTTRRQRLDHME